MRVPEPVDTWLREELAPTEDQVRRVVRHALRPGSPVARHWGLDWRWAAASAAVGLLAWGFLILSLHPKPRRGEGPKAAQRTPLLITNASGAVELLVPSTGGTAAAPPSAAHATGVVEIFNRDGCVAAVLPEGRVRYLIIGGDT